MPLASGSRLGPYEIVASIGVGGMGEVYRARDTKLKREVAIKVLPEAFAKDPERLARFQREAELLATLNHPNIAAVYGIEQSEATLAIVLELVEGETLAERIDAASPVASDFSRTTERGAGPAQAGPHARRGLALDEALPIARQIAEALEAAHEKGVVHRDLKPANIKVTPEGKVKVLDFGLAKMMDSGADLMRSAGPEGPARTSPTLSLHATMAGVILGTAAYMSPEQARGKPVDRRTDIWAFGCVLFEMLAGRQTFEPGDTISDAVAAILKNDPDWSALPVETPPHIMRLLRRCLQKDPQKRLPHIAVARIEIDEGPGEAAAAQSVVSTPALPFVAPRPLWRRAAPALIAAILVGVVAAAAAWTLKPSAPRPTVVRFSFPLPEGQVFTNVGRQLVAISPDGTKMVYVANNQLFLRAMSDLDARPIPGTQVVEGVINPVFSPDGESIAFLSNANGDWMLKKIAMSGGVAVTICPLTTNVDGMLWGSDGIVFGQRPAGIMRVAETGGTPQVLVAVNKDEVASSPQMLPDGDTVLFTLLKGVDWDKAAIVAQSLKSGKRKTLVEGASDGRYLPTGHLAYAIGGTVFAVPFSVSRLEVTRGRVPILEGVRRAFATINSGAAQFSVSNGGALLYIPGPVAVSASSGLALIDRKGALETLELPSGAYDHPRVSRDGKRITYFTDDGKDAIVWIYDLSGASQPHRLTFGGKNRFPVWAADGERVAFQSDREGDLGIFAQRADGQDQAQRLTKPEQGMVHAPESWSPDGRTLLFTATKEANVALWALSLPGKKAAPFGDVKSTEPTNATFSPDGRWVAYTPSASGGILVQPFPPVSGVRYEVSATGVHPSWRPDGKQLLYLPPSLGVYNEVSVTTTPGFAVGTPVPLPKGSLLAGGGMAPRRHDVTPDGRILGVAQGGSTDSIVPQIQVVLNWFEELRQRVPSAP